MREQMPTERLRFFGKTRMAGSLAMPLERLGFFGSGK
jgi:hypothetical protein